MSDGRRAARSLRRRVDLSIGIVAVVFAAAITGALVAAANLGEARARLADRYDPALVDSANLLAALVDQETGARGYVLAGDASFLEPWTEGQAGEAAIVADLHDVLASEPALLASLDTVEAAARTWRDQAGTRFVEATPGNTSAADLDRSKALFDDVRTSQSAFDGLVAGERATARHDLDRAATWLRVSLYALIALIVAALVGVYVALRRVVLHPLTDAVEQVGVVAGGQLDHEIVVRGPREFVELGTATNAMREQIVGQLRVADERGTELSRSNRDLEQFAYVASHDLQEPLRKVAAFCQMLQTRYGGQLDARADQYIDFAVDGAKRMQALINDLLTFSRVGRSHETIGPVSLDDAAARAVANLASAIEDAGADVRIGPLPEIVGERSLLVALFQNLIGNAIKFRDPSRPPVVTVGATPAADGVHELVVADNGIGIEPQYRERVFVVFQRLHTRDQYDGTGIGLPLCRKIVELHGGKITVDDAPNGPGSVFRFTLAGAPDTPTTTP